MRSSELFLFALLVAPMGCGGAAKSTFTCDVQTNENNECIEFKVDSSKQSAAQATCQSLGGAVSFDPCTRSGYLGVCSNVSSDGVDGTVFYYVSATTASVAGAEAECKDQGGTFSTSAPSTGSQDANAAPDMTTSGNSVLTCSSTTLCAELIVPSSETMNAQAACGGLGLPPPESGVTGICSSGNFEGVCALANETAGLYAGTADNAANACTGAGGVWMPAGGS